ncbi:MAG: argininosuccinate lyase [Candidatus Caldarchaeum sp.]
MDAPHRAALSRGMDEEAARYTSSAAFDTEIYEATVYVNAAHIKMLEKQGLVSEASVEKAVAALKQLLQTRQPLPSTVEDIHIYLEQILAEKAPEAAEMLSLGKSRNDAVVAAVKIEVRRRVYKVAEEVLDAVEALVRKSLEHAATIFPVYTHLQRAAPATFGFILQSYATRLLRCYNTLLNNLDACEESPLGSAAVAGTSAPVDREYLAQLLGFKRISWNALDATASREFLVLLLSPLHAIALVLSSFAEEMVLYSSEEFGLIQIPEELAATSSIMPQKRNPVVAEIMRTKASEVLGLLATVSGILSRQPSGYNLDLQQVTPKIWQALREVSDSLHVLKKMVERIEVNKMRAREACAPPTAAVELANHLTLKHGIGFRKAHQIAAKISRSIAEKTFTQEKLDTIFHEHGLKPLYTVGEVLNIMDPVATVQRYKAEGSANPFMVSENVDRLLKMVEEQRKRVEMERRFLEDRLQKLLG